MQQQNVHTQHSYAKIQSCRVGIPVFDMLVEEQNLLLRQIPAVQVAWNYPGTSQTGDAVTLIYPRDFRFYDNLLILRCEWRTKLLANRNEHGQSGWSPIGCEGLRIHLKSQIQFTLL